MISPAWRPRRRPVRRQTEASRKLVATRLAAHLTMTQVARLMNVHPRTITRWEIGETRPNAEEWARLTAALARWVPQPAIELAALVGAPSPIPPPRVVDLRVIEDAIMSVADRLDVAPSRVRAGVRDLLTAVARAQGSLDDLARAVQDRPRDDAPVVSP